MSKSKNPAASKKVANNIKAKKLSHVGQKLINHGINKILKELLDKDVITQKDYEIAIEQYKFINTAQKTAEEALQIKEFSPDYDDLKSLANEDETINLLAIISKPQYFNFINDVLNTALKAAGIDDCVKNFAKLYCVLNLAYPIRYYCLQSKIQRKLTGDILYMSVPGEDLHQMLSQLFSFQDLVDPNETGMLNVSDNRLREFMTA